MAISLARVSIVSIFVECILYGFFTFMFAVSVYVLLIKRRSKTETVNRPLLVVSITMFILATIVSSHSVGKADSDGYVACWLGFATVARRILGFARLNEIPFESEYGPV